MNVFTTPNIVLSGRGCFQELGTATAALGKTALVVAGGGALKQQGHLARAAELLKKAQVKPHLFGGVSSEPTLEMIDAGREKLKAVGADVVVAIGGGSVLDTGKAIAGLANESAPTRAFFDGMPLTGNGLRCVAVPTTFGTGAEVTTACVLTDPQSKLKKSIRHERTMPKVAIVDGSLGLGAPAAVTAAAGMDGVVQAIESYFSIHASSITAALSLHALKTFVEFLPRSFKKLDDVVARQQCAEAATMAGMALANARLGLAHGMAHPIGARFNLPHGLVCGVLIPHVIKFNQAESAGRYKNMSQAVGMDLMQFVMKMQAFLQLPAKLAQLNPTPEDVQAIVIQTLASGSTQANPRQPTEADLTNLLAEVTHG